MRIAAFTLLVAWWTLLGHEQSWVWQTNESLWEYTAYVQPYNLWVQKNYGTALIEAKRAEDACWQLIYVQRLASTDRVLERDREGLDQWVSDRLLMLAYLDYKGGEATVCRDDSVLV
jgi:hypothetical protein